MRPPDFLGHKIEHEVTTNPFPRVIFHFRKPYNKNLYGALYKIFMISMKYNTTLSYYAKSAMREKKGEKESCFIRHKKH